MTHFCLIKQQKKANPKVRFFCALSAERRCDLYSEIFQLGALLHRRDHGLVDRLGQPQPHLGQREDVGTEDLAGGLAWIETDGGRLIRLDAVDRLQAYRISAQWTSYHRWCPQVA